MTATNDADLERGHQLISFSDEQLAQVLEFAASVPWQTRKRFMLRVTSELFHAHGCGHWPDDADVYAACQRALAVDVAA